MTARPERARPRAAFALCALVAAVFGGVQLHLSGRDSPVFDEIAHVPAGYAYWRLPGAHLNAEHPPLVKLVAGAALLDQEIGQSGVDARAFADPMGFAFGQQLLFRSGNDARAVVEAGRRAVVVFSAALVLLVGLVAHATFGGWAGPLAALLAATEPLLVAHGHFVTTDCATALFTLAAAACAARAARAPGAPAIAGIAAAIALGMATKYSFLAAALALPGPAVLRLAWERSPQAARAALRVGLGTALGLGLGASFSWGWPPDPGAWWGGATFLLGTHRPHHPFFAFDRFDERIPAYFLRALAVKASYATLLCVPIVLLVRPWRRREPEGARPSPSPGPGAWLDSPLTFLASAAAGYYVLLEGRAFQIGARYWIPCLPLAWLLGASLLGAGATNRARVAAAALAGLAGTSITVAAGDPLSWYNGLFGCRTSRPLPCLDDSNTDWGHALPRLGEALAERFPGVRPRVAYFGTTPIDLYLDADEVDPEELLRPYRALYAVSAHRVARPGIDPPESSWVRGMPPTLAVHGSYRVFDLRGRADLPPPPAPASP